MSNLAVLAQFGAQADFGTFGNKLSISADGRFSRVSGIGGALRRKSADSFTHPDVHGKVKREFEAQLTTIKEELSANSIKAFDLCVAAFLGYRKMVNGYAANQRQTPVMTETLSDLTAMLGGKILMMALNDSTNVTTFGQAAFLPAYKNVDGDTEVDWLNGGICWGISCKWCARWLKKKEGFFASNNPQPGDVLSRIQRKTPEMFVLMHNQKLLSRHGGNVSNAMAMFDPGVSKAFPAKGAVTTMDLPLNVAAEMIQMKQRSTKPEPINALVTRKKPQYDGLRMGPRQTFRGCGKYLAPGSEEAGRRSATFLQTMKLKDNAAFMLSWRHASGGHAMAAAWSSSGHWWFMDPNFGEWKCNEVQFKALLCAIMSFYSFDADIETFATQRMHVAAP